MALMSYLLRDRHGTYYWRRVIPADLRAFMPAPWTGKANWKRSLGTKEPASAKRAGARCLSECMADFQAAEEARHSGNIPGQPSAATLDLAELEREVIAALLADDEASRTDGDARTQHQSSEARAQWPDLMPLQRRGMPEDFHVAYGEELEMLAGDYRKALSCRDPKVVDVELRAILCKRGIPIDPTAESYYRAGMTVLQAHVAAYNAMLKRQQGEIVTAPPATPSQGPKLSEAFSEWKRAADAKGGRQLSERTLMEAKHAVRRLTEWCGDVRLGALTRESTRGFRDALAQMPTRLPEAVRRLPLKGILAKDLRDYPPVHAATVNKALNLLRAIVSHAEASGSLDAVTGFRNPFGKGVKLAVDRTAAETRKPFDAKDIEAIFATAIYKKGDRPSGGGGEAAFWLPLIGLLSGARLGELVQLRVGDLAQEPESGIWYFDIGTTGGRRIKTASSRRKVPLHPELERIGLLEYRKALLEAGAALDSSLWPSLAEAKAGQPGAPWSKWFNRTLRLHAGIEDRAKVFHSFRHTFKQAARDAGLPEEVHDRLTGHVGGGVGRGYGGLGLTTLANCISRMVAPKALGGLQWSAH